MANIFISYRREDSGGHAGRLCDRLSARFGDDRVFMDLQDIAPGQDFPRSIDETIASCDCVIAVIGPRWLEAMQKRAGMAEDFVHREIAAALLRNITVIPVLVGGAGMPSAGQLPPALNPLRHRNAFELRDDRFEHDVAILCDAIAGDSAAGRSRPLRIARRYRAVLGATACLIAAVAAYMLWPRAETPRTIPVAAPAVSVFDGDWIADVQKEGQPAFRVALSLATTGGALTGTVRYPTGEGPILDAHLEGPVLTFHTSHIPQFESAPAIIRYRAELVGDEMRFTTTDLSGVGRGVARRRPAAGTVRLNPKDGASYVWIPPHRFVMGCSAGDPACEQDEQPSHEREIATGFWLARTEVADTQPSGDDLPVTGVSWAAARARCAASGGRLPTEAEWEYAARAGTTTRAYGSLAAIAWFADNSMGRPHPVGGKSPNAFGLHDMLGNVSEWVLDRYYSNAYADPGGAGEVEEPRAGNASGVARGGSWLSAADGVRVSRRLEMPPDAEEPHVGFRCAVDRL